MPLPSEPEHGRALSDAAQTRPFSRRARWSRLAHLRSRAADFVHRVLALHGTEAVRYEPGAVVDHLEIDSLRVYLRKFFVYGRSARRYARVVPARALRTAERFRVLRDTVRCGRLSTAETGLLVVLLGLGVGCYHLGWLSVLPGSTSARAAAVPSLRKVRP